MREAIRTRHYSRRTEEAYLGWIRRFSYSLEKRHPVEMGGAEVARFLSWLAVAAKVSASTQNQALNALLFLYREVLNRDLPAKGGVVRAKVTHRLPVVLTRDEVRATRLPAAVKPNLARHLAVVRHPHHKDREKGAG